MTFSKLQASILFFFLLTAILAHGQKTNSSENGQTISIYPEGAIPNAKPNSIDEIVYNPPPQNRFIIKTSKPELSIWLPPKDINTGIAVLICPGGGYTGTAIDHEGHHIAQKLNEHGIAGFVLKYRTPHTDLVENKKIVPLQDAQRALQIIKENATKRVYFNRKNRCAG